ADISKMLYRLVSEDIDLNLELKAENSYVEADPGQLEQVIINLVVNARDAMSGGGRLVIHTGNGEFTEDTKREKADIEPGKYITMSVTDTGHGMDKKIQAHIFEPFFTTKTPDSGTGLGLSTVHGIIKQSGGHITVDSVVSQGTTFTIYFPQITPDRPEEKDEVAQEKFVGDETILLVEDEEGLRNLVSHILQEHGYQVFEANQGSEALKLMTKILTPIDLLLTDVILPGGMNGPDLAIQAKSHHPQMKVIFMSGYLDNPDAIKDTDHFMQKPFGVANITQKIRQVLDESPS
ncbi:MAG: ATP-binding protein, partial [Chloroflexota bacterium]